MKTVYNLQELLLVRAQRDQMSKSSPTGARAVSQACRHQFRMLGYMQDLSFLTSVSFFCLFGCPNIKGRALALQ